MLLRRLEEVLLRRLDGAGAGTQTDCIDVSISHSQYCTSPSRQKEPLRPSHHPAWVAEKAAAKTATSRSTAPSI